METIECCATCRKSLKLEVLDYSGKGCVHREGNGFICLLFANEGIAEQMIGLEPAKGLCECWEAKK